MSLTVTPLSPAFGAEISGIDFREVPSPETIAQLKAIVPREMAELSDGDKRCLSPLTVAELAEGGLRSTPVTRLR